MVKDRYSYVAVFEYGENGISIGHTDNFLKVSVSGECEKNTLVDIKITRKINNYLEGELDERI